MPAMISALALMSIYKAPVVPLSEICDRYFSLSYDEAMRAAARNELPVPAFRLRDSRKAPMMVSCQALGDYIDACEEKARASWLHSQI
jgi:hypothetical protein